MYIYKKDICTFVSALQCAGRLAQSRVCVCVCMCQCVCMYLCVCADMCGCVYVINSPQSTQKCGL